MSLTTDSKSPHKAQSPKSREATPAPGGRMDFDKIIADLDKDAQTLRAGIDDAVAKLNQISGAKAMAEKCKAEQHVGSDDHPHEHDG